MLTTLSILSPGQGNLHPKPRTEAEYFAAFAPAAAHDAILRDGPLPSRVRRFPDFVPRIAHWIGAHRSGQ